MEYIKLTLGWLFLLPLLILLGLGYMIHKLSKTLINDRCLGMTLTTLIKIVEIKNTKL